MISKNYKNWIAILDLFTCFACRSEHGQIYEMNEFVFNEPPVHPHCRCKIEPMKARLAGTATKLKENGADWWLKNTGTLPEYYITESEAKNLGYKKRKGNLGIIALGKMLTKGVYYNDNGHLPSSPGRVFFFSNDGLIFVTYDHYHTFEEIV